MTTPHLILASGSPRRRDAVPWGLPARSAAGDASALAEYIHELNGSRDSLERSIYLAAVKQVKENFDPEADPTLVLAGVGWHAGVIGIVAGRLAEKYNRPVVVISLDQLGVKPGVGSARSACGLNRCSKRFDSIFLLIITTLAHN